MTMVLDRVTLLPQESPILSREPGGDPARCYGKPSEGPSKQSLRKQNTQSLEFEGCRDQGLTST